MSAGDVLTDREKCSVLYLQRVGGLERLVIRAGVSFNVLADAMTGEPLPASVVAAIRDGLRLALS